MKIFISKREEVTGAWEKLHDRDLHNLYTRWTGHIAGVEEMRKSY
jgi:hypothetical protein